MSGRNGAWRAIGESVVGLSHQRDGRPCQDACLLRVALGHGAVAAVADGHGQARSFRSAAGAELAVGVAVDVLLRFAKSVEQCQHAASGTRRDLAGHLPRIVAQNWRERVSEHFRSTPLNNDELAAAGECFPSAVDGMTNRERRLLWRAYGTTLIAVLAADAYSLAIQIGDGLLMAARVTGDAFEVLEADPLNFGTATTSLSDEDAELRIRWRLIPHEGDFPVLYWLCTDGYEKAFRPEDHGAVCVEYREAFRKPSGWATIAASLQEGLTRASTGGTGDDATVAFLYFEESVPSQDAPKGDGIGSEPASDGACAGHYCGGPDNPEAFTEPPNDRSAQVAEGPPPQVAVHAEDALPSHPADGEREGGGFAAEGELPASEPENRGPCWPE